MSRPIRNILFCALLPIGDTLFTTPAIRAVRMRYPQARIVALTYPTNSGILSASPDISAIWLAPTRERFGGLDQVRDLISRIRGARFDLTLEFSNYNYGLRAWGRVGAAYDMRLPRLWWVRPGAGRTWRQRHAVEHYADVARRAGIPVTDWALRIYATLDEIAACDARLRTHGVRAGEPLIGIHPGGEGLWGRKQWGARGFAEVADRLHARFGMKIVVLGGQEDARTAAQVARWSAAPVLNLAGQTTLGETAALARRCRVFIGNDSSPLHIAAAAGTRVVGIYGLTDPRSYRPWVPGGQDGRDYAVVESPAPCAACFPLVGGITVVEWLRCVRCNALAAITADQVVAAAASLLASDAL
ncbi:MAG TPA: glycosyltransferase family 9 protein [Chloroflexia bacterium]|nr:glycosyltransferase family 9 protein [Chloroflexia bacterium]